MVCFKIKYLGNNEVGKGVVGSYGKGREFDFR